MAAAKGPRAPRAPKSPAMQELDAMKKVGAILESLQPTNRARVIDFANNEYGKGPGATMAAKVATPKPAAAPAPANGASGGGDDDDLGGEEASLS